MKPLLLLGLELMAMTNRVAAEAPLDEFLKHGQPDAALTAYAEPKTATGRFSLAATQVLAAARQFFSAGFNRLLWIQVRRSCLMWRKGRSATLRPGAH